MTSESLSPVQPQTEPQTIVCSDCGCSSTLPEYFTNKPTAPRCPRCTYKLQVAQRPSTPMVLMIVIPILIIAFLVTRSYVASEQGLGFWALNLFSLYLLVYLPPLILLHEFAHMVTAWLLGGRVTMLTIGTTPIRFKTKIKNTYIIIGKWTGGGSCFCTFPSARGIIPKMFLVRISALLMHLLFVLVLLPGADRSNFSTTFAWREILIIANIYFLLANAIPKQLMMPFGPTSNDGAAVIQILKRGISAETFHVQDQIVQAKLAQDAGEYQHAFALCESGLKLYPDNIQLNEVTAYCLLQLSRFSECVTRYRQVIESPQIKSLQPLHQAIYYNNAGWSSLIQHEETDSFEFSKQCIVKAYQMAPWVMFVRATYGSLMIEEGEYQKGIALITETIEEMVAMNDSFLNQGIAENLGNCAIAYHQLGDEEEAREFLKEAVSYSPHALMVAKAQQMMNIAPSEKNVP